MTERPSGFPKAPFYDRTGALLSDREWADHLADADYCRLAVNRLYVRGQLVRVATVWCGWCLGSFNYDPPMIFETSVVGGVFNGAAWLYPTEAEAMLGHQVAIELVRDGEADRASLVEHLRLLQEQRSGYLDIPVDGEPTESLTTPA